MNGSGLPFSPAAERNQAPILAVLDQVWPAEHKVLEIASGTGQHAAHFAAARPGWDWQPSDLDAPALAAIDARCAGLVNVRPALALDVMRAWPADRFDAVYNANMLHISPWATCSALMRGAADRLGPGGTLVLYGPFVVDGEVSAESNLAFDADLRARNPDWGLRQLSVVLDEARRAGFAPQRRVSMPANNLILVLQRQAAV